MPTWGIVGSGRIAADMAKAFKYASKENQLLAVAARSLDRAKAFADEHGIPQAYGSYEELFKDDKVAIVYVSTINSQHKKDVIEALNAGKNVLCEKPAAVNRHEWDDMKEAARKSGKFLMDGLWTAFLPTYVKLLEEIRKGDLGELKSLTANFCYTISAGGDHSTAEDTSSVQKECVLSPSSGALRRLVLHRTAQSLPSPNSPEFTFDLPGDKTNYKRTICFFYEIDHVGQCVDIGLKESPVVPWEMTDTVLDICDETRRQIGLVYPMDDYEKTTEQDSN